jgi:hypothetical protein
MGNPRCSHATAPPAGRAADPASLVHAQVTLPTRFLVTTAHLIAVVTVMFDLVGAAAAALATGQCLQQALARCAETGARGARAYAKGLTSQLAAAGIRQ